MTKIIKIDLNKAFSTSTYKLFLIFFPNKNKETQLLRVLIIFNISNKSLIIDKNILKILSYMLKYLFFSKDKRLIHLYTNYKN